jgi:hypothetical protein
MLNDRRREAAYFAELGCREAAAAEDDERIHFVVTEHCHDERCGGRYFPDERPSRPLHVVG